MGEGEKEQKSKIEDLIIEAKSFFDFYKKEIIGKSARKDINVVSIEFMKLTEFSNKLSDELITNPEETLRLTELAIEELGLIKINISNKINSSLEEGSIHLNNIRLASLGWYGKEEENCRIKSIEIDSKNEIKELESEIDKMEAKLPVQSKFLIYSGAISATQIYFARSLCRRAERALVSLQKVNQKEVLIQYLKVPSSKKLRKWSTQPSHLKQPT